MRHPQFKNGLLYTPDPQLKTMKDVFLMKFKKYAKSNCLGIGFLILRKDHQAKRPKIVHRISHILTSYEGS
jgi:hypothetical protein